MFDFLFSILELLNAPQIFFSGLISIVVDFIGLVPSYMGVLFVVALFILIIRAIPFV